MLGTDPHSTDTPDRSDRTDRLLAAIRVALVAALTALVLAIAALAYVVSFEAIRAFAIETAAFPAELAWSAPLLVDSFTTAASLVIAAHTRSWWDQLRLVDSTPLPCAASRETVRRSELAGYAGYGYCKSHHRYFWGFRLYVLACPDGLPVAWCLASPKLGEREVVAALLGHERARLRPGLLLVGDKGFAGREFQQVVAGYGARLLRPDRADEPSRVGSLGRVRQWIESTFDTLKGQLGLEQHGGRTLAGVWVRVAQRLLARASGIWWNWQAGAPDKRSLVAYDH